MTLYEGSHWELGDRDESFPRNPPRERVGTYNEPQLAFFDSLEAAREYNAAVAAALGE